MTYFINNVNKVNQYTKTTNEEFFVDKSLLIEKINKHVGSASQFICITRPRRFGKTINAMMLETYYSKNANFKDLFDKLNISKCSSYEKHLNKHNVIYITFNLNAGENDTYKGYIDYYKSRLISDIKELWPDVKVNDDIPDMLSEVQSKTGEGFIFIIDEWDYIFNNNLYSEEDRNKYLLFLKNLLKDRSYVELCYMTGVLPIAKYSIGSALNMFREFNFLNDDVYYNFYGFTTKEVDDLCKKQNKLSMDELREWYDGYKIQGIDLYNPRSVVCALLDGSCKSYWTSTGPMDEILYYIKSNISQVKNDVIQMISEIPVEITLTSYSSEKLSLETKEHIFSVMTIYGFLTYHDQLLEIPNKELMLKFNEAIKDDCMDEISRLVLQSNDMLKATLNKDTEKMAEIIQEAHDINIPIIQYNNENSLAIVLSLVYLNARNYYHIVREMQAGIGFADFIFYSRDKSKPSFIVELKYNSTAQKALDQIFEKRYNLALKDYPGEKLAIGISYDSKNKKHDILIKTFL